VVPSDYLLHRDQVFKFAEGPFVDSQYFPNFIKGPAFVKGVGNGEDSAVGRLAQLLL